MIGQTWEFQTMFDKDMIKLLGFGLGLATEILGLTLAGLGLGYGIDLYFQWSAHGCAMVFSILGLSLGCYRAFKNYEKFMGSKSD